MPTKKKIVSIVLNDFTHDSRVLKECHSLLNAGYQVRVAAMYSPGLSELENKDGLEVRRLRISTRNLPNNVLFSGIKYLHLLWKMYRYSKDADIFHCNDIEALPIGVFAKWMGRNKKVVYDAHEYEREKAGIWGFRKKLIGVFESIFIRYVDKTITVGHKIAEEYAKVYAIDKPVVVMNCPVLKEVSNNKSLLRNQFNISEDKILLIVQGTLTSDRGIQETLDAFVNVNRNDMALVFMGYGSMEKQVKAFATEYKNIFFMPSVPPEVVVSYTASADVGLTFIENNSLSYYYSLPNKFFEYIHADLAIISWPLYEIKSIIESTEIGFVTEEFSGKAIEKVLKNLSKDQISKYKENVYKLKYKYNWKVQEERLLELYNDLYK